MPSTHSDSDPLLAFSSEVRDAPQATADRTSTPEATVSVTDTAPRPAVITVDPAIEALTSRVVRLERAVDDVKLQNAQLKSDVETLVRAVADIRTRASRVPAPVAAAPAKPRYRAASAAAAVLLGSVLGVGGWIYASNQVEPATPPAPQEVEAPPPIEGPAPPPVAAPSVEVTAAPVVAQARLVAHHVPKTAVPASPEARATMYVGTLSIDADPGGEVFINRQTAGHTPLRVANLKAGSHLVWIEREGYRRWTRVVEVPADRVSRVWADLDPIPTR